MSVPSFGWKRKVEQTASVSASVKIFNDDDDVADDPAQSSNETAKKNWDSSLKAKRLRLEESCEKRAQELTDKGADLAAEKKYKEALNCWDEAVQLSPKDFKIHEMRAQVLMQLNRYFEAVEAAELSVKFSERSWWVALQTLGRAQLALGEAEMALKSFLEACHLNPWDEELRTDDIGHIRELIKQKKALQNLDDSDSSSSKPVSAQCSLICDDAKRRKLSEVAGSSSSLDQCSGNLDDTFVAFRT